MAEQLGTRKIQNLIRQIDATIRSFGPKEAGGADKRWSQDTPGLSLDKDKMRIQVSGKWYELTSAQTKMLAVLFKAEGTWVAGKNIGGRPDKTRQSMPKPVARIIETDKAKGYRIRPGLLTNPAK